jgi:hypothetical protein
MCYVLSLLDYLYRFKNKYLYSAAATSERRLFQNARARSLADSPAHNFPSGTLRFHWNIRRLRRNIIGTCWIAWNITWFNELRRYPWELAGFGLQRGYAYGNLTYP